MTILIAPDKFKGSLSAYEVAQAIQRGIHRFDPQIQTLLKPLADGGDGSLEILQNYFEVETVTAVVADPLFRPIEAQYLMRGKIAFIEMAAASGLVLLQPDERNCLQTTSLGTGQLIVDAVRRGAQTIYLFIGGSATNDGGIGMAQAVGYRFLDQRQQPIAPIGKNLSQIASIDASHLKIDPQTIRVQVVCDVNNPFYGKQGAAYVYAPQKGANATAVERLDQGLRQLATVLEKQQFSFDAAQAGTGAAGGLGGGAMAFLGAQLRSGIELFLEWSDLDKLVPKVDGIITGEGKMDEQTMQGKVISGVLKLAQRHQVPCFAICGASTIEAAQLPQLQAIYSVMNISNSLEEAMQNGATKVSQLAEQLVQEQWS